MATVRILLPTGIIRNTSTMQKRSLSSSLRAVYQQFGNPSDVVKLENFDRETENYDKPTEGKVSIRMAAAPINPSDINQIEGVYPRAPPLPAVGGNEGVAYVERVGENVSKFTPKDQVIPRYSCFGTWRTHAVVDASSLIKLPEAIPDHLAACISVNPSTAWRMLKDFRSLSPGDTVMQNGGNSGVGQSVVQIAGALGVNTVSIVRDRENFEVLKSELETMGNRNGGLHFVVSDTFARSPQMTSFLKKNLPSKPVLGFNCVGGKEVTFVLRHLAPQSTLVTYGGMSRSPLLVPTGSLIFSDITLKGFWLAKWKEDASEEAHASMLLGVCRLINAGKFTLKTEQQSFASSFSSALHKAQQPYAQKQVLTF